MSPARIKDKEITDFSFLRLRKHSLDSCKLGICRKDPQGRGRHMIVYSVSFPETLALESSLVKRYGCIQEKALSQTKCALKARQSKMIGQRKPR